VRVAARNLQVMLAYLVVASVGTLLAGMALGNASGIAAALYYLLHSTLIAGALFLLADLIGLQRGAIGTDLISAGPLRQPLLLGMLFFLGAISVAGLPPFSGFLGKLMLMRAVELNSQAAWLWTVLLVGGLGMLIALSRAGSLVFWRTNDECPAIAGAGVDPIRLLATLGLLSASLLLVVLAQPVQGYLQATASQLLNLQPYLQTITGGGA